MGNPYRTLRPGDGPIPAAALNAAIRGGMAALRAKGGIRSPRHAAELAQPATEVLVKWAGADTLPVHSVVTYADAVVDPADKPLAVAAMPIFEGDEPASADDAFAVMLEPARSGGLARAATMGVTVADVLVNDADHTHATATPGETAYLTSAASGRAEIVWKPSGTGVKTCVVLLGSGGGGVSADEESFQWQYTITASATFQDAGATTLTLPSAGEYLVYYRCDFGGKASAVNADSGNFVAAQLYDVTAGLPVPGSFLIGVTVPVANVHCVMTGCCVTRYTVSEPSVLRLEGLRSGATTWTLAYIGTAFGTVDSETIGIGYVKVG